MVTHGKASLKVSRPWLVVIRSAVGLVSMLFAYICLKEVDLVNTSVLMNTTPLFVPFRDLAMAQKTYRPSPLDPHHRRLFRHPFILKPTTDIFSGTSIYGLGSGILSAVTATAVRASTKTEEMHTLLFYYFLIGFILFLPFNLLDWQSPDSLIHFLGVCAIGLFSALGQWSRFKGLSYAKTSQLTPFGYTGILFAGLLQYIFWDEIPDLWAWVGIVLTCGAGLFGSSYQYSLSKILEIISSVKAP